MDIHLKNYPYGANSRDIVRVMWIFLHAQDTILTYGYSCWGLIKSKNVLLLRIYISPDGHTDGHLINSNHNLMTTNDGKSIVVKLGLFQYHGW